MVLTYDEYKAMGGRCDEAAYPRMEAKAGAELNRLTFGRLKGMEEISGNAKYCLLEMIEVLCVEESLAAMTGGREISAMSNDGVSMSFSANGSGARSPANGSGARSLSARLAAIAHMYLADEITADGIPLLYAGVDMR